MAAIEDLICYVYEELSETERERIEEELHASWPLREKLSVLQESKNRLNRIKLLSPRKQTLEKIMNYAEKTSKLPSNLKA